MRREEEGPGVQLSVKRWCFLEQTLKEMVSIKTSFYKIKHVCVKQRLITDVACLKQQLILKCYYMIAEVITLYHHSVAILSCMFR